MTAFLRFRRVLACSMAICVAVTGLMPRCGAAPTRPEARRTCCCGGPGECRCGDACACLTPQPAPANTNGAEKADPRVKPAEPSVPGASAAANKATDAVVRGGPRPLTALTRFPSLRALEVRIQT